MLYGLDVTESYKCFLAALKKAVDDRLISGKDLADKSGVSAVHISMVLKGKRGASTALQERIAGAIGLEHMEMVKQGYRLIYGREPVEPASEPVRRRDSDIDSSNIDSVLFGVGKAYREAIANGEKWRMVLDTIPDGIMVANAKMMVTYANQSWRTMTGGNPTGKLCKAQEFCQNKDHECLLKKVLETGVACQKEIQLGEAYIIMSASPIREAGEISGVVLAAKNITARREMMQDLEALNARLEATVEMIDRGIIIADEHRNIIYCNQTYKDITGMGDITSMDVLASHLSLRIVNYKEFIDARTAAWRDKKPSNLNVEFVGGKKYIMSFKPLRTSNAEFIGFMGIITPNKK